MGNNCCVGYTKLDLGQVTLKPESPTTWEDSTFSMENLSLYSEEAEYRAKLLKDVSYCLILNLSAVYESGFNGSFRACFSLNEMPDDEKPLFLDFQGQTISNVKLNGIIMSKD